MKSTISLVVLLGIMCVAVAQKAKYTPKYDAVNIETVLGNDRVLGNYIACLLDSKPCTREGRELKSKWKMRWPNPAVLGQPIVRETNRHFSKNEDQRWISRKNSHNSDIIGVLHTWCESFRFAGISDTHGIQKSSILIKSLRRAKYYYFFAIIYTFIERMTSKWRSRTSLFSHHIFNKWYSDFSLLSKFIDFYSVSFSRLPLDCCFLFLCDIVEV